MAGPNISPQDIAFFIENGYLIKENTVHNPFHRLIKWRIIKDAQTFFLKLHSKHCRCAVFILKRCVFHSH